MPSTYTNLGIELMADGEKANTWGTVTNENWEMTEEALTGKATITISGNYSLASYSDGIATNNARKFYLRFEGSLSGTATITLPTNDKIYGIENATTGSQSITLSCGSGNNVTIGNGNSAIIHTSVSGQNVQNLSLSTSSSVTDAIAKIPSSWTNSAQSILGLTDTPSGFGTVGQVLKVNSSTNALEFADDSSGSAGISLADARNGLSVSSLNPSGGQNAQLGYTASTGQFTFAPPDLSGYATTGQLSGYASAGDTPANYVANLSFTQSTIVNGTYVFAAVSPASTTTYSYGSTISGGNLLPTGAITTWGTSVTNQAMNSSSTLPGTWRCMGQRQPHPSNTYAWTINMATLWIKVSG